MTANITRLAATVLMSSMLMLTACGGPQLTSAPQQASPGSALMLQPVAKAAPDALLADVGKGITTPAKLSFSINLETVAGFSTKASTAGTAAKTVTDLTHIKFYLVGSATGTPPTALSGTGFSHAITATNRTNNRVDVTFTNVTANTTGQSYYVLVGGFSSATTTAANNITNAAAPISDATEGLYYHSNAGGDAVNPGCVRVTPTTYALSGTTALVIPLKLFNAISPTLDSDVNITAGDEVSGSPSGSGS